MFWVYALSSISRNYIYVGLTNDMDRRFSQHQSGQKKTLTIEAIYSVLYEGFLEELKQGKKEKYLIWIGKEFVKAL